MRVIAGIFKSRVLQAPPGLATRPSSDRLRETLFNVLAPRIEGAAFLDLYAGSGAVGIEALSRGAARVTFVERSPAALRVLRKNLENLGIHEGVHEPVRLQTASVAAFLRRAAVPRLEPERYEVVFLDPPYDAEEEYKLVLGLLGDVASTVLAQGATVVSEHRRKDRLDEQYGALVRTRLLEQGDAGLSFFSQR